MKTVRIIILSILIIAIITATSEAGWLIYHKPAFKGRVIDAETKELIEGVVVVVIYKKQSLINGPGGGYSSVIKVKETLTNKKGEFNFPSYTTVIQPNLVEDYAEFIIFKPGYGNFPAQRRSPPIGMPLGDIETFFSKETGSRGNVEILVIKDNKSEWKLVNITFGIVELPKLNTMEERLNSRMIGITGYTSKDLPLLYKARDEDIAASVIK
jgi:hypothetical protein